MSELIVIGYDNAFQAEEVRVKLLKLQRDYLIDLEDAVVAVKQPDGKVKLNQVYQLTQTGAVAGGFWGALIGMLFLNPLLGAAVGAGAGAISGALTDVGINDQFMKELAATFTPVRRPCSSWSAKRPPTRCWRSCKEPAERCLRLPCPTRTKRNSGRLGCRQAGLSHPFGFLRTTSALAGGGTPGGPRCPPRRSAPTRVRSYGRRGLPCRRSTPREWHSRGFARR